MSGVRVPKVVRDRLGDEATFGLLEVFDSAKSSWSDQVLTLATDRFERRLTEELSKLRLELVEELHRGLTSVRAEMATIRVELLRWSFLFWIGQVGAVAGLLAYMLRR